mmetsp:Transcript_35317/g.97759  ORF Transcript_35317/g.97759 Transcript_35317/m.97759 type:complete len:359 (-) Transcript_35317:103-1179(-)
MDVRCGRPLSFRSARPRQTSHGARISRRSPVGPRRSKGGTKRSAESASADGARATPPKGRAVWLLRAAAEAPPVGVPSVSDVSARHALDAGVSLAPRDATGQRRGTPPAQRARSRCAASLGRRVDALSVVAQRRASLIEGRRRVAQRALELLVRRLLRLLSPPQPLDRNLLLLLHVGDEDVGGVAPALFDEHPVLHLRLQRLLVQHASLHLLLLHRLAMLLNHLVDVLRARDVLRLLRRDVLVDELPLLPEDVGLRLLLLPQRLRVLPDRLCLPLPRPLQPLARTLHLLVRIVRLERLAHVVLLVARLERDDLVRAPPRLLDLLQRLALLLPQPLEAVPQQLHVVLRAQPRVFDVEHV